MNFLPFFLVIVSAFTHGAWNALAKEGLDKTAFMWLMSITSIFTVMPVFYFLLPNLNLTLKVVPFLMASGVLQALSFMLLFRAYELGDLSIVYPLARSSPLFLFVLAVVLLGEKVSAWGASGIMLVLLGVYTIHLKGLSKCDLLEPISSLRSRASQFALLTALCGSVYSLVDKLGVMEMNPIAYAFWLDFFINIFLTPMVFWRIGFSVISAEWSASGIQTVLSGFLMYFGYILVLVAMSLAQVSYILSVRQLSIVIGAALGVWLLGEKHGRFRLISALIIFIGVVVIGVMA